jgi:hypothetical protein
MEQPCINIASPYVGCEQEVYRLGDLENKKKWLQPKGFLNNANNASKKERYSDTHYVTADPSEPPMLHQFRNEDKETYLFGNFNIS